MKHKTLKQHEQEWRDSIASMLRDTDMSYHAISREVGCTAMTVYVHARRLGLRRSADKVVTNG